MMSDENERRQRALAGRVNVLIDNHRVFEVFWQAADHFNTTDLVLVFDEAAEVDPVTAYTREALISRPDIPDSMRRKICEPARDAARSLHYAPIAFWLFAYFSDGEAVCTAVNAKPTAAPGHA